MLLYIEEGEQDRHSGEEDMVYMVCLNPVCRYIMVLYAYIC